MQLVGEVAFDMIYLLFAAVGPDSIAQSVRLKELLIEMKTEELRLSDVLVEPSESEAKTVSQPAWRSQLNSG